MATQTSEISKAALSEKVFTSLARTDDILALIGVIILIGTIAEAFGGYWQGVLAKNQYIKEFVAGEGTPQEIEDIRKRDKKILIITIIVTAIVGIVIGYSVSRKKKCGTGEGMLLN